MKDLNDKVVAITGAGSGIGRELAIKFAGESSRLALSDVNEQGLAETVKQLNLPEDRLVTLMVDASDRVATENFADSVVKKFGQVDILINNAGLAAPGPFDELSLENFERVINVNMWGVIHGCRAFLPHLKNRPEAILANVSSINGMVPFINGAPYNMSKYAVYGLNETLMMELKGTPVHLLSIHPGGIKTNIANYAIGADDDQKRDFDQFAITSSEQAAVTIVKAVKAKKSYLFIGRDAKLMQLVKRISPRAALYFVARHYAPLLER